MPWVIWDILVPLLVTFLIGIGTGWLLWRWRRQRADIAHSQTEQVVTVDNQADDSANAILIKERDDALERASVAEAELESLKIEQEFSIPGLPEATTDAVSVTNASVIEDADSSAEVESLNSELEQEKNTRAELERSLLDLNSRYKQLSVRLEEAVSNEEAATIKQSAAIESEVERSREKIAEQQEALRLQAESEEQAQEKYTKDLTEKEAQLKRLQSEKDDLQSQLEKANAANQNLIENGKAPVSNTDSVQPTGRVHRLSANSTEESSLEPGAHSMSGPSEKSADACLLYTSPSPRDRG